MLTIMKVGGGGGGSEVAPTNLEIITDKIKSNSPVVSRANLYPFNWLENGANLYFIFITRTQLMAFRGVLKKEKSGIEWTFNSFF